MLVALASQDTREVVLVHEVTLPALSPLLFGCGANVLLLVLGEDELGTPTSLTTATLPLSVGTSVNGLRDTEDIASVVPLHVLLQVQLELTIGSSCARNTSQGVLAATRAELLAHVLGGQETAVAAQDECSKVLDALQSRCRQQVQVHL